MTFVKMGELSIELARGLSDAYALRQLSDYEETVLLTRQQAETVFASAQIFVTQTKQYCSNVSS